MTTVLAEPGDAVLRPHAEQEYQAELTALAAGDDRPRPPGWRLSPWAVTTYLLGGTAPDGTAITPKYVGSRRLIEVAVAPLAPATSIRRREPTYFGVITAPSGAVPPSR